MEWKPYSACCHASAADADAAFCGECGAPLLRCVAYAECRSLVEPLKPCAACLGSELFVDQGAVTNARIGQQLSVPLILRNTSRAARPLWVKDAAVRRDGEAFRSIPLPWERIDAGEERMLAVSTGALDAGGTGTLEISLTLGTRYKGYEECYLYGSAISLSIDAETDGKIEQHINFAGAQFGTGGLVQIKDVAAGGDAAAGAADRVPVPFERFERFEIERGTRGYRSSGLRIPRVAPFRFIGFPPGHAPQSEISLGSRSALAFGRNSRRFDATDNPTPSDIVLRAIDPATGALDADGSYSFSRHHFDLVIQNERLCVHVRSSNGILVNDDHVSTTKLHVLNDGDTITPVANRPDLLAMRVQFVTQPDGSLAQIQIIRTPEQSA